MQEEILLCKCAEEKLGKSGKHLFWPNFSETTEPNPGDKHLWFLQEPVDALDG